MPATGVNNLLIPPAPGTIDLARLLYACESALVARAGARPTERTAVSAMREIVSATVLEAESVEFCQLLVEALLLEPFLRWRAGMPPRERGLWRACDPDTVGIRTLVAYRASGAKIVPSCFAPDGLRYAVLDKKGASVVDRGARIRSHRSVEFLTCLDPVTYVAVERGKRRLHRGDEVGPPFERFESMFLKNDSFGIGTELAYVGVRGRHRHVVLGPYESAAFDAVALCGIRPATFHQLAPGAYVAELAHGPLLFVGRRGRKAFAVADGVEYGPYRAALSLHLSAEGPVFAGYNRDGTWSVLLGELELARGDAVPYLSVHDGTLVYVLREGDEERLRCRGQKGPAFRSIDMDVRWVDGRPCYRGRRKAGEFVVWGDVEWGPFRHVDFAPDMGSEFPCFAARANRTEWVVRHGQREVRGLQNVIGIFLTRDGLAYVHGAPSGYHVVIGDWTSPPFQGVRRHHDACALPCLLDGRVLYEAWNGRRSRVGYGRELYAEHDAVHVTTMQVADRPLYAARDGRTWSLCQGDETLARLLRRPTHVALSAEPTDARHVLVEVRYSPTNFEIVSVPVE